MICAANWKMNKSPAESRTFMAELKTQLKAGENKNLILLPPALCLSTVLESAQPLKIPTGGQACDWHQSGAYTGENSPQVLAAMGAEYCLVGHSERRQLFGEIDERVTRKARAAQDAGITPIICIGESADERLSGQTEKVLARQLDVGFSELDIKKPFWIAYEPVWAIGTGVVATAEQVADTHGFILKRVKEKWNLQPTLLYGGSVKADNAGELKKVKGVDGFLIGGASLEVNSLLAILRA